MLEPHLPATFNVKIPSTYDHNLTEILPSSSARTRTTRNQCPYLPDRTSFVSRDREVALREWVCARIQASSMVNSRGGTFTPSPAQTIVTGVSHSPHGAFSAGASPSTNSPTGPGSNVAGVVIVQLYVLLSTIKEDKDRTKWEQQAEQIRKVWICCAILMEMKNATDLLTFFAADR